jgi:hypothetical protein
VKGNGFIKNETVYDRNNEGANVRLQSRHSKIRLAEVCSNDLPAGEVGSEKIWCRDAL